MSLIEINWKPDRRQLAGFGTICVIAFAAIGLFIFLKHGVIGIDMVERTAWITAGIFWGLALLCGVLRFVAPSALRPLYVALTAIALPIGFVLSHVLLAILFFGVFTPIGLVFRFIGHDPLHRRFDRDGTTYWVPREPEPDVKRYFRQF
jgi:hypothetical protein